MRGKHLWVCLLMVPGLAQAADAGAGVTIEVFSDFQCPYCKMFAPAVRAMESKGVEGVRTNVEFKNFPLGFHPFAQLAAQAAMAAGEQGKFWEMHDLLFANQSALGRENLLKYAQSLKLDMGWFRRDLDSDRVKAIVEADRELGRKRGVSGTPTFFIDGKRYSGTRTFEQLAKLVAGERRTKQVLEEVGESLMSRGPAHAPVTLEFFADLESPVTPLALCVVNEAMRRYPSAVRLQFRNFPLAFHPQAPLAHNAAMAAARERRFWEFANYILGHQDALREQDLIAYAGRLGLDEKKFAEDIERQRYAPRVEADVEEGMKRGLRGSPVVFVNGKRIDGVPSLQLLTKDIEDELAANDAKR